MLKNIRHLFKKHFWTMFLNMAGLALAFCASLLIAVQVIYELSFDRSYPGYERIYRVDMPANSSIFRSILPPGFANDIINSSAHIESGTIFCPFVGEKYLSVSNGSSEDPVFLQEVNMVSPGIFDVFGIKIAEGDKESIRNEGFAAIPESLARRLFGNEPAVGKKIHQISKGGFTGSDDWTVGVVYKDLPENSQIRNNIWLNLPEFFNLNYGASNFSCWIRLDDSASKEEVEDLFNSSFDFGQHPHLSEIELVPVADIYYMEGSSDKRVYKGGDITQTRILIAASILVILIGLFNYTNFYTSLVPARLKEINTRKVLGASVWRLRFSMIQETAFLSLTAYVIAIVAAGRISTILHSTGMLSTSFSLSSYPWLSLAGLGIAVLSGMAAGIYPGFYATSVRPALALQGRGTVSPAGKRIKTALLGLQYVISSALLIFALAILSQNRMMGRSDSGFDKDVLAVVELTSDMVSKDGERFRNELLKYAEIEDVAFAMEALGTQDTYVTQSMEWRGKELMYFTHYCSDNFPEVLGLDIIQGKGFSKDTRGAVIFTDDARTRYGLELGHVSNENLDADIIGFCENARFSSLRKEATPSCFIPVPAGYGYLSVAYIRFRPGSDIQALTRHITETLDRIDPSFPAEVLFYDTILDKVYAKEKNFCTLIELMSTLAILLSLTGVLGMAIFDIHYMKKRIAISHVLGAEVSDIVISGNRYYMVIFLICYVISVPIALTATMRWLENFTVRTDIRIWIFAVAFAVILALNSAVVSLLFNKAARANPAEGINKE